MGCQEAGKQGWKFEVFGLPRIYCLSNRRNINWPTHSALAFSQITSMCLR